MSGTRRKRAGFFRVLRRSGGAGRTGRPMPCLPAALAFLACLACLTSSASFARGRLPAAAPETARVTLGSKAFAESWILGEALARLAADSGVSVEHRRNLGGTEIVFGGLQRGSIDLYPEYTGTIAEVILRSPERLTLEQMRSALAGQGLAISDPLGFHNGYALAVLPETQERLNLYRISDLRRHPQLRLAFTHEFIGRQDGWEGLARHYGLRMSNVRGIQHELAYDALASRQIDLMEIYTTDAQIERLGLRLLEDDRDFFPRYDAVLLYRADLALRAPAALASMERLVGRIDEETMIRANGRLALDRQPAETAAMALLEDALGDVGSLPAAAPPGMLSNVMRNTLRHLQLVGISLLAAVLVGIPLGIIAARSRLLAGTTLSAAGLLQTIPSLALLAFLIPVFGIGLIPALVALFLYSLLPIVRNTYVGLTTLPPALMEAAEAIGLSPQAQLLRVRLPLASPAVMAGIKTSAVINVGTATLAALIGAEGLGNPIMQGIALRDSGLILQGAVPAALLALVVQSLFGLLDRVVIPRGLRLPASSSD
jgi:osmoprotectant transport system permease protein